MKHLWGLDPDVVFLNHGSFGACPTAVLAFQRSLMARMESQPVRFFARDTQGLLDGARDAMARFVGAPTEDLVFVANATTGVNTVLKSLRLTRDDELLVSNQEYNACRNALDEVARRARARVVVVDIPFPITDTFDVVGAFLEKVTPNTRLLLVDHVVSQTGLVMPIADIVDAMQARGIEVLVDGAHAPGMLELDLSALGATYYTGNCHKWMCSPKTAAFLYVHPSKHDEVHPLVTSHGASLSGPQKFHAEFDWVGTIDPTPVMTLPFLIDFMDGLVEGGWSEIRQHNHALALAGRRLVCDALEQDLPCPDHMVGSTASVVLPNGDGVARAIDPLQDRLLFDYGIEVPVIPWPGPPRRLLRISAQLYNSLEDYERLAVALRALLAD
ncbi:MAG: aminotransferase class V-fold PLP-dependent enzyme [bacterium]